jgi:hypothetical protein
MIMRNTEYVDIVRKMDFLDSAIEYESELESDWDSVTRHIFHLQEQIFHRYA